jgi:hypothetical protein
MFIRYRCNRFQNNRLNFPTTTKKSTLQLLLVDLTDDDAVDESMISRQSEFHSEVQRNNTIVQQP